MSEQGRNMLMFSYLDITDQQVVNVAEEHVAQFSEESLERESDFLKTFVCFWTPGGEGGGCFGVCRL